MGDALSTIRTAVRLEVFDPSPERLPDASTTFTHDGGANTAYFEDGGENFVTEGVGVGDVVENTTDGSLSVIKAISNGNARLEFESTEGGTDNDFDNGDVIKIYDRYAQNGLGHEKWSDARILLAINKAQKKIAMRQGGVEKTALIDIPVFSRAMLVDVSATYTVGEVLTGGDNGHTATVVFAGTDYVIFKDMLTKIDFDGDVGTLLVGEVVTGGTNEYTAIVQVVNATDIFVYDPTGEFEDDEVLTGASSGATVVVNEATSYSSNLFILNETLTGGTSNATANVKAAYTVNNINLGQDIPTGMLKIDGIRWFTGSTWRILDVKHIDRILERTISTGDPRQVAIFADNLWFWPNRSLRALKLVMINYFGLPSALSADTDTTELDTIFMHELELESAKILAGWDADTELRGRVDADLKEAAAGAIMRRQRPESEEINDDENLDAYAYGSVFRVY
jgi:hypothetical protein